MKQNNIVKSIPKDLYLFITHECNLKCRCCPYWQNKDQPMVMSLAQNIDLIKNFKRINPYGHVSFMGGEPMLKKERLLAIAKTCNELGIYS